MPVPSPYGYRSERCSAVGADAGLAGIPVFRGDGTFDRHLDIGGVEDDERRIAAQFERVLLGRAGTLLHQQLADFGRAGEGQFTDDRVPGQLAADLLRPAGDAACKKTALDILI
jgi:hypothetical protein